METSSNQTQEVQGGVAQIVVPSTPFHKKINLYPSLRHILLVILVILGFTLVLFLMHQNGKSIYENGI